MVAKRQRKRETQQNSMPLPPARSEKGNENRGNPRNPLPFSACEAGKGNEKRETQQNPMPLPPARSEKGNENRGNPRNPLPFSACEAGKGNEKRETQQNPMPFSACEAGKGNENRGNSRNSLPHSCFPPILYPLSNYCGSYLYTGKREKDKICKKCLRKIKLSFIMYMEIVTKIKGIYYEGRKGYDEKKNT